MVITRLGSLSAKVSTVVVIEISEMDYVVISVGEAGSTVICVGFPRLKTVCTGIVVNVGSRVAPVRVRNCH